MLTDGERLINIADAMREKKYEYKVQAGENVGFIFPVYFYTVPTIVSEFVSKLRLEEAEYVYAIITCGGSKRND